MLGDEIGTIHSRTELTELLKIHVEHGALDVETGREVAGAMNYKELSVREVMTPMKDCFMLSVSEKLNFKVRVAFSSFVVFSVSAAKKLSSGARLTDVTVALLQTNGPNGGQWGCKVGNLSSSKSSYKKVMKRRNVDRPSRSSFFVFVDSTLAVPCAC